jgi:WD40 repeat protein
VGQPPLNANKLRQLMITLAQLAAWSAFLALAACHASVPGTLAPLIPTTIASSTPIVESSETPTAHSASITPSISMTASPAIVPTETSQPETQALTSVNVSGLQLLARRDYAPNELITALAWSPDGTRLAVAAGEQIHWLDGDSLEELRLLPIGAFSRSLAFSPDGVWLAAGSQDGLVRLWQTKALDQPGASPDPVFSLPAHKKGVNQVTFHPTRPLLATGGDDAIARVWNLLTGEQVNQIIGGTFAVPGLAFSPDGVYLAVMNGSVIRLRDAESGRMYATLRVETNLFSLAFSPSGDELAAGDNAGGIWVWPQDNFQSAANVQPPPRHLDTGAASGGQTGLVWQVSFSPDGSLLGAALGNGSLQIWDAYNGEKRWTAQLADRAVTSLAFRPGGYWLVSGGLNASLQLWGVMP